MGIHSTVGHRRPGVAALVVALAVTAAWSGDAAAAAPATMLPAGVQYDTANPVALPPGIGTPMFDGSSWYVLDQVDSAIPTCARDTGPCSTFAGNPVVHAVAADGTVTTTPIDDVTTYPLPGGYSMPSNGLRPTGIVRGAVGFVVAGAAGIWDSDLFHDVTIRSVLWFSPDGISWQRVDLRDVVGDVNLLVTAVAANGAGFLAAGEIGGTDMGAPSRGIVLASVDGVAWHTVTELPGTYSVDVAALRADGDVVVVSGLEYVCTTDSGAMSSFSVGGQTRVWASVDRGATFAPLDLAAAGVSGSFPAGPADPAACPADLNERDTFAAGLSLVDVAGGRVVLGAPDAVTVATTGDLTTWTTAALPDGAPTTGGESAPPASERLVVDDGGALVIASMEPRRDDSGYPLGYGTQVLAWRSADGGATWTGLDRARPLRPEQTGTPRHVGDGLVAMTGVGAGDGASTVLLAPAAELAAWGTCEPAPAADCSFADLGGQQLAGVDVHGIDLAGATLTDAVLDGADLTGADLTGVALGGASLRGAALDGAQLAGVRLAGSDVTGTSLAGADLSGARVTAQQFVDADVAGATLAGIGVEFDSPGVEGLVLSGADLTGSTFLNYGSVVTLHHANFDGANLTKVIFSGIDLTGATFAGTAFGSADDYTLTAFSDTVICPDGQPSDTTQPGPAACRLA